MNIRLLISLAIMFFSLMAFFTLIEAKWKNRKRIKNTRGYKLLCPKCDTIVAEILFPSERLIIHYNWHGYTRSGERRIKREARKLGEGVYRLNCRKCGQELIFDADKVRKKMEKWIKDDAR